MPLNGFGGLLVLILISNVQSLEPPMILNLSVVNEQHASPTSSLSSASSAPIIDVYTTLIIQGQPALVVLDNRWSDLAIKSNVPWLNKALLPACENCENLVCTNFVNQLENLQVTVENQSFVSKVTLIPENYQSSIWSKAVGRFGIKKASKDGQGLMDIMLRTLSTQVYTLDINPPDGNLASTLSLGGTGYGTKDLSNQIIWSEVVDFWGCQFSYSSIVTVFHFSVICNDHEAIGNDGNGTNEIDLFGLETSNKQAIIAIDRSCLVLPSSAFRSLLAWVPLKCEPEQEYQICERTFLPLEYDEQSLPSLRFQLSENGTPLYIPLKSLLLNTTTSLGREICIQESNPMKTGDSNLMFGIQVLYSLKIIADLNARRYGFVQKNTDFDFNANSTGICSKSKQNKCFGAQTYDQQTNRCVSPAACDNYLFQAVDEETQICSLRLSFFYTMIAFILTFLVADLAQYRIQSKLIKREADRG